ncbi:MAG: hypothetical protein HKN62_11155 [Phycisphaerales bacterium]|nr:hypothetical protein [Phycisphaerales bacterium]
MAVALCASAARAANDPEPVAGPESAIVRLEQIERQETPARLAEALNETIQRLRRETESERRRRLIDRREALERRVERDTGWILRGYTRRLDADGELAPRANLVLFADARLRPQVESLSPGALLRVTLGPWRASTTIDNTRHHAVGAIHEIRSHPLWSARARAEQPWSHLEPDAWLTREARLELALKEEPLARDVPGAPPVNLYAFALTSRADRTILSCRAQALAYSESGAIVGPFDVLVPGPLEPGETFHFGIAAPRDLVIDGYSLELRVREIELESDDLR